MMTIVQALEIAKRRFNSQKRNCAERRIPAPEWADVKAVFEAAHAAGMRCTYCDRELLYKDEKPYIRVASLDHDMPLSRGGTHAINNLQVSCCGCNLAKGTLTGTEWIVVVMDLTRNGMKDFDTYLLGICLGKVASKLDREDAAVEGGW